jgi:hypothetical protein
MDRQYLTEIPRDIAVSFDSEVEWIHPRRAEPYGQPLPIWKARPPGFGRLSCRSGRDSRTAEGASGEKGRTAPMDNWNNYSLEAPVFAALSSELLRQ